jgi:hypothetical protein
LASLPSFSAPLADGGHVTSVIPPALVAKKVAYEGFSELRIVASMYEQKATKTKLADSLGALDARAIL